MASTKIIQLVSRTADAVLAEAAIQATGAWTAMETADTPNPEKRRELLARLTWLATHSDPKAKNGAPFSYRRAAELAGRESNGQWQGWYSTAIMLARLRDAEENTKADTLEAAFLTKSHRSILDTLGDTITAIRAEGGAAPEKPAKVKSPVELCARFLTAMTKRATAAQTLNTEQTWSLVTKLPAFNAVECLIAKLTGVPYNIRLKLTDADRTRTDADAVDNETAQDVAALVKAAEEGTAQTVVEPPLPEKASPERVTAPTLPTDAELDAIAAGTTEPPASTLVVTVKAETVPEDPKVQALLNRRSGARRAAKNTVVANG